MLGSSDKKNVQATEELAQRLMQGDLDAVGDAFAPDFVDHDPAPDQGEGAEGLRDFWSSFLAAFPDLQIKPEQVVADDDKVAIAYTVSGTQQGEFMGHAPTGKRMSVRGMQITRIEDGKVVERWGATDQLTMLEQLGLTPANV